MKSQFNAWFLDDGSIGDNVSVLLSNLEQVRSLGEKVSLTLNEDKCEIATDYADVVTQIRAVMPNIRHVPRDRALLLGAPVGDNFSTNRIFNNKLVSC